ncbi:MAG: DUF4241 domain-containing protein [Clostridiales bacterium]|nr:DUF4241 domain-containing protein [Clostridiales bacterium]
MYINEENLNSAYEDEATLMSEGLEITLTKLSLGDLYLSTGLIVANDPFVCFETEPFTISVEPGHYPVTISVAHYPIRETVGEDRRVALAMLRFSDQKPVRWEMAVTSEKQAAGLSELGEDDFFGYGVDSGTGGFMDKAVADKIAKDTDTDFYEKFEEELEATYVHTYNYLLCSAYGGEHKDFACFSSGWGDGSYPSYFGFDDEGRPCSLVTDFCIL